MTSKPKLSLSTDVSFADIQPLLSQLPPADLEAKSHMQAYLAGIKNKGHDLKSFEPWIEWLASWQARFPVRLRRPRIILFADNGDNTFDAGSFLNADAPLYKACQALDTDIRLYEIAGEGGEEECARAMAYGMMAVEQGIDVIGLAAIPHTLHQETVKKIMLDLTLNKNPYDLLKALPYQSIAAMVGVIIAARLARVPVVAEGPIGIAAAAVVKALAPLGADHVAFIGDKDQQASKVHVMETVSSQAITGLGLGEALLKLKYIAASCGGDI